MALFFRQRFAKLNTACNNCRRPGVFGIQKVHVIALTFFSTPLSMWLHRANSCSTIVRGKYSFCNVPFRTGPHYSQRVEHGNQRMLVPATDALQVPEHSSLCCIWRPTVGDIARFRKLAESFLGDIPQSFLELRIMFSRFILHIYDTMTFDTITNYHIVKLLDNRMPPSQHTAKFWVRSKNMSLCVAKPDRHLLSWSMLQSMEPLHEYVCIFHLCSAPPHHARRCRTQHAGWTPFNAFSPSRDTKQLVTNEYRQSRDGRLNSNLVLGHVAQNAYEWCFASAKTYSFTLQWSW